MNHTQILESRCPSLGMPAPRGLAPLNHNSLRIHLHQARATKTSLAFLVLQIRTRTHLNRNSQLGFLEIWVPIPNSLNKVRVYLVPRSKRSPSSRAEAYLEPWVKVPNSSLNKEVVCSVVWARVRSSSNSNSNSSPNSRRATFSLALVLIQPHSLSLSLSNKVVGSLADWDRAHNSNNWVNSNSSSSSNHRVAASLDSRNRGSRLSGKKGLVNVSPWVDPSLFNKLTV